MQSEWLYGYVFRVRLLVANDECPFLNTRCAAKVETDSYIIQIIFILVENEKGWVSSWPKILKNK